MAAVGHSHLTNSLVVKTGSPDVYNETSRLATAEKQTIRERADKGFACESGTAFAAP